MKLFMAVLFSSVVWAVLICPFASSVSGTDDMFLDEPARRSDYWWPYQLTPPYQTLQDKLKPSVIRLEVGEFDTEIGDLSVPEELTARDLEKTESGYFIVQFTGPIHERDKEMVCAAGAVFFDYIPNFAFIVRMSESQKNHVAQLKEIRWIGRYQPAYKIDPHIGKMHFRSQERLADPKYTLTVSAFRPEALDELAEMITDLGGRILDRTTNGIRSSVTIKIEPQAIPVMAQMEEVKWIEEVAEFYAFNDETQEVIQSGNLAGGTPVWDHGLHGEGQIIGHLDTGVDVDHCFYRDPSQPLPNSIPNYSHRKIVAYRTYADGQSYDRCSGGHGTHTAGTIAGYTTNSAGMPYNGIAYSAKLTVGDIGEDSFLSCFLGFLSVPSSLTGIFNDAMGDGAYLHSNSWGSTENMYDSMCQDTDGFMWTNKHFLILYAAGNSGPDGSTVGTPATSKNIVCVGGSNNEPDQDQMFDASSRGPVNASNRMAPMVTAPATDGSGFFGGIDSANSDGQTSGETCDITGPGYQGTSMACPAACGAAALIRQYFMDGYYPTGSEVAVNGFTPTAALIKATLINSARNMTGVGFRPNNDQGWGRILLDDSLYFAGETGKLLVYDQVAGLSSGQSMAFPFTVNSGSIPLKVTLVWTDQPGNFLVNDLDLTLANASATWRGNNFSNGWSTSGATIDRSAPTECIFLQNGSFSAGDYVVTVTGYNVPSGEPGNGQPFAVVISGDVTETIPPTPTPGCVHNGDVNLNGSVTAGDAQIAFEITLGVHSPTYDEACAADCNGNGDITAGDAQAIFMTALGSGSCVDTVSDT